MTIFFLILAAVGAYDTLYNGRGVVLMVAIILLLLFPFALLSELLKITK